MRGSLRADITSRPWTIDGFDAVSHKFTRYLYLSDRALLLHLGPTTHGKLTPNHIMCSSLVSHTAMEVIFFHAPNYHRKQAPTRPVPDGKKQA